MFADNINYRILNKLSLRNCTFETSEARTSLLFAYSIPLPISAPPRGPDAENKRPEFFRETLGDSQSARLPAPLAHLWQNNNPSQLASC